MNKINLNNKIKNYKHTNNPKKKKKICNIRSKIKLIKNKI